ncbi:MAG TPA: cyclic nucleotide-binding domain-containing protein [Puia sp.]|nr:cyclic nucleotide-binding domain-containing protein [Puia sp.]
MKEILRYLCENYWQLTNDAKHYILENTDEIRIAAGEVLLKPGETCNYVWFIKTGLLRAYQEHYDEKRGTFKIYNNWFMTENDIATSVVSCFRQVPSVETVEAVEDTVVFRMSRKDLLAGVERFHSLALLTLFIVLKYYCDTKILEGFLRMKDPEHLQQYMLQTCPELLGRLSENLKHSFFGISDTKYRNVKSGRAAGKEAGGSNASKKSNKKSGGK